MLCTTYFRYKKVYGTLGILGILGRDDIFMVVYYQWMALYDMTVFMYIFDVKKF